MGRNGVLFYAVSLMLVATMMLLPHFASAQYTCGSGQYACGYGTCPSGEVCTRIFDPLCTGHNGYQCESGTTTATTVKSTTSTAPTTASTTASTSATTSATTTIPSQSTTTVAHGSTASTSTAQGGSGPTLPTTSVPAGVSGHTSTTVPTTIITTTIAPQHGTLILTETGLPSGVIFGAYLQSQPGFVYAVNTSINDSVVFPDINTGGQTYEALNVTVVGSAGTGSLYQSVPASGAVNITDNHTSVQEVRFIATQITTTLMPTTTVQAGSNGGGVGGVMQGIVNAIEGFFSYLFGGS